MRKLHQTNISSFFIALSFIFIVAGNAWSVVPLPDLLFSGNMQTTSGIGTGTLTFNPIIFSSMIMYKDGTSVIANNADESMIGSILTLTGAVRTGDYSYTDATLAISDPNNSSFKYLTATLSNINFITDGSNWYMNPLVNDQNLSSIVLNTDANHPSRFINEFQQSLETNNVSAMKLMLTPVSGNFSGNSTMSVFSGLVAGPAPVVPEPVSSILFLSGAATLALRRYKKIKS